MPFVHTVRDRGDVLRAIDWNAFGVEIMRLESDKVNRTGGEVEGNLRVGGRLDAGELTVAGELKALGDATVGSPRRGAALRVLKRQETGTAEDEGALILGTDEPSSASFRLGYHRDYAWLQAHGQQALSVNPAGGTVGIGTTTPRATLDVAGSLRVDAAVDLDGEVAFGKRTRQMLNLWSAEYGIGIQSATQYFRTARNFAWHRGGAHADGACDPGGGTALMVLREGRLGVGTPEPSHNFHVRAPAAVGLFESTEGQAYLRISTREGIDKRVEVCNRGGQRLALWTGSDVVSVTNTARVGINTAAPTTALDVNGVVTAQVYVSTSPMVHRMYPADPIVHQDIFAARDAGAIVRMGSAPYDDTKYPAKNPWNGRPIIQFGGNEDKDGNGAQVTIPAGMDTAWVRVLGGDRWTSIKAYFTDGAKEQLGFWTGGYRSLNPYSPDGSLSDGHNPGGGQEFHQWVPIAAGRAGALALVAGRGTGGNMWFSGVAFSRNPWAHAGQSAVGYHWNLNGGSKVEWENNGNDWNKDVLGRILPRLRTKLMVPVVSNGRDKLLYLIEHNNFWSGCGHSGIYVNGTPVERFLSTYDNPFARHWNSKPYERYIAARVPASLIPAGQRYMTVEIDTAFQNSVMYFREIGTHDFDPPATA